MSLDIDLDLPPHSLPGFRLAKLEVYNWGTFDGAVYSVATQGATTLLIGENGSGKSTLVDALLTLLVRPQTRNYNVAAGASKNERDERTYIRGAFDRTVGDDGRPQIQYLRSGRGHYTVVLGCFSNAAIGKSFTLCQVLHLDSNNQVEKVYAFSDSERSIVADLSHLTLSHSLSKQLRERGFQTTSSYKEYFEWMRRATGMRSKAMDIFNQTVAVKDVQRLDDFIRQHMLERKPWQERVGQLLKHFTELSDAHRSLVRVRTQAELLAPIAKEGARYAEGRTAFQSAGRLCDLAPIYFATEQVRILEPLCAQWTIQLEQFSYSIDQLQQKQNRILQTISRLELEMEQASGDRLRQLPNLIGHCEQLAALKLQHRKQFDSLLARAGIRSSVTSAEQFSKLQTKLRAQQQASEADRVVTTKRLSQITLDMDRIQQRLGEEREEFQALQESRGNLPANLLGLRNKMCSELQIAPSEIPFAAELMAVKPGQSDWENSIEQVLFSLARSLLIPETYYSQIASYVDQNRLLDHRGNGQRLVYVRVNASPSKQAVKRNSGAIKAPLLIDKLDFRNDHPLSPWLRTEIESRFNYLACESIEEFQQSDGPAMTRNRHVKSNRSRHEKDDRSPTGDSQHKHYVLGWDNSAKQTASQSSIRELETKLAEMMREAKANQDRLDAQTQKISAISQALLVLDFDSIDPSCHEYEASQLRIEQQQLESSCDIVQDLRKKVSQLRAEAEGYGQDRDAAIISRTNCEAELKNGLQLLKSAQRKVQQFGIQDIHHLPSEDIQSIRSMLPHPLTVDSIVSITERLERQLRDELEKHRERLKPLEREVTSAMTRFLKRFPDEQSDLDASVDSLTSFLALHDRITRDDLPKHEARFKQRLNEKVLHELGLFRGELEVERQEIHDRIEQLNSALRRLEWKPGSYMQLEPVEVADREIQDFRRELAACLSGSFQAAAESNEKAFVRIEKLIEKLRDDSNSRWREKVVDVRNWFGFAAQEIMAETGHVRSYYDGGTGQSGGEKGKLAFLVLVAAIAYQYDLEPDSEASNRFHFVMVDEMFSRSDDAHAEYALELFERFRLQLLIVAPLDAKARVTEPYVGTYLHVVKNKKTNRSDLLAITAEQMQEAIELP